jgi:hypothetical protein
MASPEPAAARIQWQGSFAISQYGPIATPYCEEEQIAIVARSYGWKVSGAEIHNKSTPEGLCLPNPRQRCPVEGIMRRLRT